jgi:hypothetical protein
MKFYPGENYCEKCGFELRNFRSHETFCEECLEPEPVQKCTHCGANIVRKRMDRKMCEGCRNMSLQERMERFPHIRELANRIYRQFSQAFEGLK